VKRREEEYLRRRVEANRKARDLKKQLEELEINKALQESPGRSSYEQPLLSGGKALSPCQGE
jgi:predicted alpha/beta-hydrolase family hydrolase